MSKAGDLFVRFCNSLHRIPCLSLCFLLILIQACVTDYYLVHHLAIQHFFWAAGDVLVLILTLACFRLTPSVNSNPERDRDESKTNSIAWIVWLTMQSLLAAKVVVIFSHFSEKLKEEASSFFGPNTLKTTIALGSCIFILLLTSQHDAPLASDRRRYIEELTGTVVFDVLDTADILEILFDEEERPGLSSGIPELILLVATLNLLLPTIPLLTLSKTRFGLEKLRKRLIYLHRLLLVLAVNVPNLIVRMVLWHKFSVGISPFTLKNIILISMTLYEFYEHKKEKFGEHKLEALEIRERRGTHKDGERVFTVETVKQQENSVYQTCESNMKAEARFDLENRLDTAVF